MRCPTIVELPDPPAGQTGWPWTEPTSVQDGRLTPAQETANWPKVTIVTTSYNQGMYLEATIRSVLLQGYPNLEYIVVDGGSTDGSVDIIRKYEKYMAWWNSEKDRGPCHALNKGFVRATGDLHAFLNSDDYYEPGALKEAAKAFGGGHQWIVGRVNYLQEGLGIWPVPQLPGNRFTDWFVCCPISQPGCFWSAKLHRAVGEFREDLHFLFDYEFWLRLRFGQKLRPFVIDRPIAFYRLHTESKTIGQSSDSIRVARAIRDQYLSQLTFGQRVWLSVVRRHRRARGCGSRAVSLLKQGDVRSAASRAIRAYVIWPLLVFDLGGLFLVVRELFTKKHKPVFPQVWPEWDE